MIHHLALAPATDGLPVAKSRRQVSEGSLMLGLVSIARALVEARSGQWSGGDPGGRASRRNPDWVLQIAG